MFLTNQKFDSNLVDGIKRIADGNTPTSRNSIVLTPDNPRTMPRAAHYWRTLDFKHSETPKDRCSLFQTLQSSMGSSLDFDKNVMSVGDSNGWTSSTETNPTSPVQKTVEIGIALTPLPPSTTIEQKIKRHLPHKDNDSKEIALPKNNIFENNDEAVPSLTQNDEDDDGVNAMMNTLRLLTTTSNKSPTTSHYFDPENANSFADHHQDINNFLTQFNNTSPFNKKLAADDIQTVLSTPPSSFEVTKKGQTIKTSSTSYENMPCITETENFSECLFGGASGFATHLSPEQFFQSTTSSKDNNLMNTNSSDFSDSAFGMTSSSLNQFAQTSPPILSTVPFQSCEGGICNLLEASQQEQSHSSHEVVEHSFEGRGVSSPSSSPMHPTSLNSIAQTFHELQRQIIQQQQQQQRQQESEQQEQQQQQQLHNHRLPEFLHLQQQQQCQQSNFPPGTYSPQQQQQQLLSDQLSFSITNSVSPQQSTYSNNNNSDIYYNYPYGESPNPLSVNSDVMGVAGAHQSIFYPLHGESIHPPQYVLPPNSNQQQQQQQFQKKQELNRCLHLRLKRSGKYNEGPTYWGMWEDERSRMIYVSWLPRTARAINRNEKKKRELALKEFIQNILGFGRLEKVLLFPPTSAHCKLLFTNEASARAFLEVFGGFEQGPGPALWKVVVCRHFCVDIRDGIHCTRVRIIWADQTKNDAEGEHFQRQFLPSARSGFNSHCPQKKIEQQSSLMNYFHADNVLAQSYHRSEAHQKRSVNPLYELL